LRQGLQEFGLTPVHAPAPHGGSAYQACLFQQLQMLDDGGTRYGQIARELSGSTWRTCQSLIDDQPRRMAEQREYAVHPPQFRGTGMRSGDVDIPD